MCLGDFNEIMYDYEKQGGALRPARQMVEFQEMIHDCGFLDMPFIGPRFTWTRRFGSDIIAERLDKSLVNKIWFDRFLFSRDEHLSVSSSDHLHLLIHIRSKW